MAKKIYKYELEIKDLNKIIMPKGAEILSVQTQHNKGCIWALVDTEADVENRFFEILGTGNSLPDASRRNFIGTFQIDSGLLVFHCFELIKL